MLFCSRLIDTEGRKGGEEEENSRRDTEGWKSLRSLQSSREPGGVMRAPATLKVAESSEQSMAPLWEALPHEYTV